MENNRIDTPNPEQKNTLGRDVYDDVKKLNFQIATKGPAFLYAMSKVSEAATNSNLITSVSGMVIGVYGFFGNRYYRSKGEDSGYSYMGQLIGGIQFTTGFLLLALEGLKIYYDQDSSETLISLLKMSGIALSVAESTLILLNSYLYSEDSPKPPPGPKFKPE